MLVWGKCTVQKIQNQISLISAGFLHMGKIVDFEYNVLVDLGTHFIGTL